MKVLFVCLGNICRSPLAEAIFKHKIKNLGLDGEVFADSCGTANYHVGDTPDPRTIKNARMNRIEINHLGRQFSTKDFEKFDYVLAMDKSNYRNVLDLAVGNQKDKIYLLREFDSEEGDEVPDPYYGGDEGFQLVFEMLDRSIDSFINHLQKDRQDFTNT